MSTPDLAQARIPDSGSMHAAGCAHLTRWPAAPDSWWRKAAQRIDAIRQAPLRITVTDGQGRPCPGVEVEIKQTQTAFAWGSAVNECRLGATENSADLERYRRDWSLKPSGQWYLDLGHQQWRTRERRRGNTDPGLNTPGCIAWGNP